MRSGEREATSFIFHVSVGSVYSSEPVVSKESTASAFGLEITSVKPRKTVTINDSSAVGDSLLFVDRGFNSTLFQSRNRTNDTRRKSFDSPDIISQPTATTNSRF